MAAPTPPQLQTPLSPSPSSQHQHHTLLPTTIPTPTPKTLTITSPTSSPLLLSHGASLLASLRAASAVADLRKLHARAIKSGLFYDPRVQSSLVRMYAKRRACRDALDALGECSAPNVVCQNELVIGFCRIGDLGSARKVFDGMAERNVVSWSVMVDGYARKGKMDSAQELFDAMPERNHFAWNSLISGYLRCGDVEMARSIFDWMVSDWGVITWTAMISGYVKNRRFKEAVELFIRMQVNGVKPNNVTIISLLPAIAHLGALSCGRSIHSYVIKLGIELDSLLGSALLDMYSKCGCIEGAIRIFENLKKRELSAWNSIILGLAAHGRGVDAVDLFLRMQEYDPQLIPNGITFIALLSACSHSGLIGEGKAVFDLFTNKYRLTPNLRHYGCMIDMLGRAGLLKEALEFVEKMPVEPNSIIWKSLISACRAHKDVEMADRVWRKVIESGPQDSGFYVLLSNIFNDVGRLEDAGRVRTEMNDMRVRKVAGRSCIEVDGVVHEFFMGGEGFHARSREIMCVLHELEGLMKLEEYIIDN